MSDTSRTQVFRRSPAYVFWSVVWGILTAAVGLSSLGTGSLVWLALCFAISVCMFVNAFWSWRTPYAVVDRQGLTTYRGIVLPPQTVAWSDVKHVRTKANGRLYLLDADFKGMSIRMKTVTTAERGPLLAEVARRSGRRLLPMPQKAAPRI